MGQVVGDAYTKLNEHGYTPVYPEAGQLPGGPDAARPVDTPRSAPSRPHLSSPSAASGAASGASTNGWTFWTADTPDGRFSLAAIRDNTFPAPVTRNPRSSGKSPRPDSAAIARTSGAAAPAIPHALVL